MSNRLEALRVFCAAADAANFRDAAVRLAVSPQVVTRAVRELEEELGEPLFHRSTRAPRSAGSMRCSTAPTGARCRSTRARCASPRPTSTAGG